MLRGLVIVGEAACMSHFTSLQTTKYKKNLPFQSCVFIFHGLVILPFFVF